MRRLFVFVTGTVTFAALLIAAICVLGQWLGPSSVAAKIVIPGSCSQPCWRGIQPGQTTLSEATILLKADKPFIGSVYQARQGKDVPTLDEAICWSIAVAPHWNGCAGHNIVDTGPVNQIELSPPPGIFSLGEAIILFDDPVAVQMCRRYVSVYFPHDVEVVVAARNVPRLDPQQSVILVRFLYPDTEPPYPFDMPRWRGFITWPNAITC